MTGLNVLEIPFGKAICYSGYREGQSPITHDYPSEQEIIEDLRILSRHWQYLRLYDCSLHAVRVLEAIRAEKFDFQVMLGVDIAAEMSNPGCPWGADYSEETLAANKLANDQQIEGLIRLANTYPDSVFAVSIGNEAAVDWGDNVVPVERLVAFAEKVKENTIQPLTYCENYVPWTSKLQPLVEILDFISVHSYPVWEYQKIEDALAYTQANYDSVANYYPDKPVIITEAGWATNSNGRGIEPWNASQALQAEYCQQLVRWSHKHQILTFVFEAFDEPWKGSDDPMEPEKHWGLYTVDRQPKQVMEGLYKDF